MEFEFITDQESKAFCHLIVQSMIESFSIDEEEALGRLNKAWVNLEITGPDDVIYHEDESYWANSIYYGKGSKWWLSKEVLEPLPYP